MVDLPRLLLLHQHLLLVAEVMEGTPTTAIPIVVTPIMAIPIVVTRVMVTLVMETQIINKHVMVFINEV